MAEKTRAEFILEVVRMLLWPVLVIMAVIWLGSDVKDILRNRTWKIGVVEVGDRITGLEDTVQDSLLAQKDYLAKIRNSAGDRDKVIKLVDDASQQLVGVQKGIGKEIQNIQKTIPNETVAKSDRSSRQTAKSISQATPSSAREWELAGFQRLKERDASGAIEAFSQAEKIWPDYHNVAEIRQALVREGSEIAKKDSPKWKDLYRHLLEQLSWGMPVDVRRDIQGYLDKT